MQFLRPLLKIALTITIFSIPLSSPCYAQVPGALTEFITEGNFDIIANTFIRIGLIASDPGYRGAFIAIIVLCILGAGLKALKQHLLDGKQGWPWISWMGSTAIGLAIYAAFALNTSTFLVRDITNNKFITVTNIPDGIALVALVANKIEQGIISIIETSATPSAYGDTYLNNPRGVTFDAISKVFSGGVNLAGTTGPDADGVLNSANLQSYVRDCFFFELNRAGSTVGLEEVDNNTDFIPLLQQGANPAVSTIYYTNASKAGETVSCLVSWGRINNYLSSLNDTHNTVVEFYRERCGEAGFAERVAGASGNNLEQQCKDKITGFVQNHILGGMAISSSALFKQYLVASEIHNVLLKESPGTAVQYLGNYQTGSHLTSSGILAEEWMPYIKPMLFAIFLGFSPFLLMMATTPFYGRAVALFFGCFFFFICWGICDAILHEYAMDAAIDVMRDLVSGSLGLHSMLMFESESSKAFVCFAPYQFYAFMIAGAFSAVLVRFGGSAMSRLGMMEVQRLQSEAAAASNRVFNPSGMSSALDGMTGAMPAMAMHNRYGFSGMTAHGQTDLGTRHETTQGVMDTYGGVDSAIGAQSGANVNAVQGKVAQDRAVDHIAAGGGRKTQAIHDKLAAFNKGSEAKTVSGAEKTFGNMALATRESAAANLHRMRQGSADNFAITGIGNQAGITPLGVQDQLAQTDKAEKFGHSEASRSYADKRAGSDELAGAMERESFGMGRAEGAIAQGQEEGLTPWESGSVGGEMQQTDALARHEAKQTAGADNYSGGIEAQSYERSAEAAYKQAWDEIMTGGRQGVVSAEKIKGVFHGNNISRPIGRHETVTVSPRNMAEAQNLAQKLTYDTGRSVSAKELFGARVKVAAYTGDNGYITAQTFDFQQGGSGTIFDNERTYKGGISETTTAARGGFFMDRSYKAAQRMFDPSITPAQREEQVFAHHHAMAGFLSSIGDHRGEEITFTRAGAFVSTPGGAKSGTLIPFGGRTEISGTNIERTGYNLYMNELRGIYTDALSTSTAKDGTVNWNRAAAYYRAHESEWARDRFEKMNLSENAFGGDAIYGSWKERIDLYLDDHKTEDGKAISLGRDLILEDGIVKRK